MANVYIWRYEPGNYFNGIVFDDKISIKRVLVESFPIFNFVSEEESGIAQYKSGDFDIRLIIDGGELSISGDNIQRFFKGVTRNYKYIVGIQFGSKQFWGFTTNEFIKYNYLTRILEISCSTLESEAKHSIRKGFVGLLDTNRTFDDFLVNVLLPQNVQRLNVTKAFSSYGSLIGDSSVVFNAQLERSMDIVGKTNVWDSFVELMVGTGLNYKVKYTKSQIDFDENYPLFTLYIFSLENLTPSLSPLKIIEAEDTTLFRRLEWLYIQYRNWDWVPYRSEGDTTTFIQDGIATNGSITYYSDSKRKLPPPVPVPADYFPMFAENETSPGTKFTIWNSGPQVVKTLYLDTDTRKVNMPLYSYTYNFEGNYSGLNNPAGKSIAFCRCLNGNNWDFTSVQSFAASQYKRYVGGLAKRAKRVKVVFDETSDFELWKTVRLNAEGETLTYYISEINNIDLANREAEILLIQT